MGLPGDLEELRDVWRGSTWRVRAMLLVAGCTATSSVASLSESVVQWKGFLLAGIEFYQEHFRDRVVNLVGEWTPIDLSPEYLDYIAILSLAVGGFARGRLLSLRKGNRSLPAVAIASSVFLLGAAIFQAAVAPPSEQPPLLLGAILYIFMLTLMLSPVRSEWDTLAIIYMVFPPLVVCIAAAINLGLTQ